MYNRMAEPGDGEEGKAPLPEQTSPAPPYQPPDATTQQPMANYPPQNYPPQNYPPQGYPPQPMYPAGQQQQQQTSNTTVVIQQPQQQVVVQGPRGWSTGICSCFDDCGVCLLGCFCPCILECTVSGSAGECCCVGSMCPIALRTKIRTRHNIQGTIMDDCCILTFCRICALCQMAREVNIHGI